MKRKRGKKGKSKKPSNMGMSEADPSIVNLSGEDVSEPDDIEKDETNSRMDTETPSSTGISTGTDQPEKPAPVASTGVNDKPVGRLVYNRVKVKIKPSKALEPQLTTSDVHTHSDTDKSSQQMGLEKQVISDKVEDSANSVPESNVGASVTNAKKAGSIKIKSSKGFGSSLSPCNNAGAEKTQEEKPQQKDPESLSRDSVYNKQELNGSLEVIKKIMKMDAAEPFNVPVNPVALGIPDYFVVIKTPMDFGTICSNLENGLKYKNSEDVYKDVQYIWENCYKYNNKGDYILELMKRVKKNFSKYWSAAGLYSEQQQGDVKDGNVSSHGKKGGHLKHKSRKRHGVKRHKDDCLCAICVMMRRRKEREKIMHPNDDQAETSDGPVQEAKPEGTSTMGSPNGDDSSSSTDNSHNQDGDGDMDDKGDEVRMENPKEQEEKRKETTPRANEEEAIAQKSHLEKRQDVQMVEAGDDVNNEEKPIQRDDETAAVEHQKPKDAGEKAKMYETLRKRYENPLVLELCGSLFPENPKSLWSGPHSMVRRPNSSCSSPIEGAIATLMKW